MLLYHRTSIFESNAQTVVNTVNCVGVMGKGVAAEFRRRYPDMFEQYRALCDRGALEPGKLWLWKGADQWVLNFPTKIHWRNPSRLEWIEAGLQKFAAEFERRGITDVSFPRLGCGNGNLDWNDVRPMMEQYLAPLPINIYVHDFEHSVGIPEHLERARDDVSCNEVFDGSFERFLRQLTSVVDRVGDSMLDLDTQQPFTARVAEERLFIQTDHLVSVLEGDDLHGIWSTLLTGVLTQDKVGWAKGEEATRLMSLLSLLPCTRPIQVQRQSKPMSEMAVELRRKPGAEGAVERNEQFELSWG
jgi:O-acetyl-ADP-ribose deacetylase (regulator of RNase III)